MNEKMFENNRIIVKQAVAFDKDKRQDGRFPRDRPFMGHGGIIRKGPQPNDICHNCQRPGHWANQCTEERKPMR